MFVKETKVKRSGREYSYLQLVEGYRDENGKVRHRVVANLGRKDAPSRRSRCARLLLLNVMNEGRAV